MRIEVIPNEVTTKDGKKFIAYKAVTPKGKLIDLRFTRDCDDLPTTHCFINVADGYANVDRSYKYPRIWVHSIESIEPYVPKPVDLNEI